MESIGQFLVWVNLQRKSFSNGKNLESTIRSLVLLIDSRFVWRTGYSQYSGRVQQGNPIFLTSRNRMINHLPWEGMEDRNQIWQRRSFQSTRLYVCRYAAGDLRR